MIRMMMKNKMMKNKMLCEILLTIMLGVTSSVDSLQKISDNKKSADLLSLRSNVNNIQARIDAGKLEGILDIKKLFSPGFGIFKKILPEQLSARPQRETR